MESISFELKEGQEFIELIKLLQVLNMAQSGGHAKIMVTEGAVHVNGEQEFRKRKKLQVDDTISIEGFNILIK